MSSTLSDSNSLHSASPSSSKEMPRSRKRGRNASRVGMACIPCRQSKLKCDGNKPSCHRCATRSQDCFWAALDGRSTEAKKDRRTSDQDVAESSIRAERAIDQLELLANAAVEGHSFPPPSTALPGPSSITSSIGDQLRSSPALYPQHSLPPPPPAFQQSYYGNPHFSTNTHSPKYHNLNYYQRHLPSPSPIPPPDSHTYFSASSSLKPIRSPAAFSPASRQNLPPPSLLTPQPKPDSHASPSSFSQQLGTPGMNTPTALMSVSGTDSANVHQPMWWERRGGAQNILRRGTALSPAVTDPLAGFDWSSLGLEPEHMTDDMVDMLTGKVVWVDPPNSILNGNTKTDPIQAIDGGVNAESVVDSNSGALLTTQTEQDSKTGSSEVVRIQYFRLLGPTGISPGIKKISMELKLTPSVRRALFDSNSPSTSKPGAQRVDWERLIANSSAAGETEDVGEGEAQSLSEDDLGNLKSGAESRPELFEGDVPAQWVLNELLPIFFDRLGDHYPCLNRVGLESRLGLNSTSPSPAKSVPPMLINIICALAARYSTHPHITGGRSVQRAHTFGKQFARKAKDFLATSLAVPGRTTILAFLMIAWHEFACNLDSAFWNYGGMALRMAIDLGLQRHLPTARDTRDMADADLIDDALLFWSVYQMDRILVVGTGRPTSIKDREITCPMPSIVDSPDNANILFAYYIRHVRIGGRIAETINAVLLPDELTREEIQKELDVLESELIESYETIPSHLRLNTVNFKASTQKHLFLEFHLWFHNLLFILNRSPIVEMRKSLLPLDAVKVVRKSVQRCADVVALDDAYDNKILESVPMANQTLFLAGCAELEESQQHFVDNGNVFQTIAKNGDGGVPRSSIHLMREAEDGYKKFASALERIAIYWDGVRWIHGVLTQRQLGRSHTDLVELAVGTDALVSKRELRLLQRLRSGEGRGSGAGVGEQEEVGESGNGHSKPTTRSPSRAPLEFSDVASLDELASLLPQVQSILSSQYPTVSTNSPARVGN
ncbi:uncharacterized protein FA14DRAFT_171332 [Meira miltonrushii]|uniref:Zn(2)-C6 fungal-type domain-containing protein n=1 Tax=Meira miltonrushii TaxID=1280837 RepID=A0A316VAS9_9BASI|nr:uncharacterized protein FA14DRAFT_171332 [Meira miltonrushii]PWN34560.1 hypothetical protein FA14DRAFT_171332 [Meira miltonrushii]